MTNSNTSARRASGFTLIEIMVALALLLVAVVGLMRLQLVGFHANQGARAQTGAVQLARELAGGLEKLDWNDSRLTATGTAGSQPPPGFGRLLGSGSTTGVQTWDDSSPVPGVRLDSAITDRESDGTPTFKRRWTVWDYADGTGRAAGGRLIAVSVIFRERTSPVSYEVVYFGFQGNTGAAIANAGAYQ